MLVFNYKKRITVEQALEHPYFSELHDEDEEVSPGSEYDWTLSLLILTFLVVF